MGKFNSFEEIVSWQKARELNLEFYLISNSNVSFSKDFGLRDQMRRRAYQFRQILQKVLNAKQQKNLLDFYTLQKPLLVNFVHNYIWQLI